MKYQQSNHVGARWGGGGGIEQKRKQREREREREREGERSPWTGISVW